MTNAMRPDAIALFVVVAGGCCVGDMSARHENVVRCTILSYRPREPSHSHVFPPYLSKYHSADTTGIRHHVASCRLEAFTFADTYSLLTLTPKSGTHRFGRMEDRMAMNLLLFGARGEVSYL